MKKEIFNKKIAQELRAAREKKGFTQKEMAEVLQVKQSSIAGFEDGGGALTTETIRKYGEALGFDVVVRLVKRKRKRSSGKPISEPFIEAGEECSSCDGTGWCEGGRLTIKTTCSHCEGTGVKK